MKSKLSLQKKWQSFFVGAVLIRNHRYHIEGKRQKHEIICPRYIFGDGSSVIVIPWFLIPGRPYPIQVYLYACGYYSSNPDMGQRAAAEATRTAFNLKKFSHSTVSRSFRAFEESRKRGLELRFGEEFKVCSEEIPDLVVVAAVKPEVKRSDSPRAARRFPTVIETAERRKAMAEFLCDILDIPKCNIESTSRQFVEKWYKKNRRLLL